VIQGPADAGVAIAVYAFSYKSGHTREAPPMVQQAEGPETQSLPQRRSSATAATKPITLRD